MAVATYTGVVREGRIHLAEPVDLPEGNQVYVVIPNLIEEDVARRKANRWLVEYVGNMVMAAEPELIRSGSQTTWRFGAFITAPSLMPRGPIGAVEVDAFTGIVLTSPHKAAKMIEHGATFEYPLSPSKS